MRGHGRTFASGKGKQRKSVWKLQCQGTLYWSCPILPFGIVEGTFFPTTFLEIAVNSVNISSLCPCHSKPMVFKINNVIEINAAWTGCNVGYRNTFIPKTLLSYNGPAVRIKGTSQRGKIWLKKQTKRKREKKTVQQKNKWLSWESNLDYLQGRSAPWPRCHAAKDNIKWENFSCKFFFFASRLRTGYSSQESSDVSL